MSSAQLGKGSTRPPKTPGKYRLYSMEFCPFAQRARIILLVKNVPHDIVNINLRDKPEWYFEIHSEGKVPALDTGDQVVVESLDIADFLNDKFPDPPLYTHDDDIKARDKKLFEKFEQVPRGTREMIMDKNVELPEGVIAFYQAFNEELAQRGTTFLGGSRPGMADYMFWPWIERVSLPALLHGKENILKEGTTKFPRVVEWKKNMEKVKAVADTMFTPEQHAEPYKRYLNVK